jgi:hypothetical protein
MNANPCSGTTALPALNAPPAPEGHYQRDYTVFVALPRASAARRDPLGFSRERMLRGQAEIAQGLGRSHEDAMNGLLARLRPVSD